MGRVDTHLAACAIAVALLTGASSAVSAADTGDSAASGSTNSSDSASGTGESADNSDGSTFSGGIYSGGANADTAVDKPGSTGQEGTGGAAGSGGAESGEKKPVDDNSGTDNGPGRTITRAPTPLPEAPPPVDLAPLPEEVPPPPLAPVPPPIDQPPGMPAEPRPVDSTTVGASAFLHGGNAPPVLTAPVMIAPVPAMPGPIVGASIAPRATFGGPAFTSSSRWSGEPAPPIRQPSTSEPLPTNVGLTARGQTSKEAGYPNQYLRGPRLSEMAAGALPGVAGMLIMTLAGVCLGYRQAMAGQLLPPQGADRFLA
jgi:hypothetical protein